MIAAAVVEEAEKFVTRRLSEYDDRLVFVRGLNTTTFSILDVKEKGETQSLSYLSTMRANERRRESRDNIMYHTKRLITQSQTLRLRLTVTSMTMVRSRK
jgi:hypothetical protein